MAMKTAMYGILGRQRRRRTDVFNNGLTFVSNADHYGFALRWYRSLLGRDRRIRDLKTNGCLH
ncbi:hypothetical protein [Microvirga aerophila]|jgi:hypothetical protein|uniref:Uncharacterized protein n=1 Tax=Microvirga aerophila TaxID=670291 RepID=A0A512C3R9_9HYPH|nr:hypothetical protein [Microvirga aerophila]GEO18855.1 hypothetical protein MAE02_65510 [Microvirga aerophila]